MRSKFLFYVQLLLEYWFTNLQFKHRNLKKFATKDVLMNAFLLTWYISGFEKSLHDNGVCFFLYTFLNSIFKTAIMTEHAIINHLWSFLTTKLLWPKHINKDNYISYVDDKQISNKPIFSNMNGNFFLFSQWLDI